MSLSVLKLINKQVIPDIIKLKKTNNIHQINKIQKISLNIFNTHKINNITKDIVKTKLNLFFSKYFSIFQKHKKKHKTTTKKSIVGFNILFKNKKLDLILTRIVFLHVKLKPKKLLTNNYNFGILSIKEFFEIPLDFGLNLNLMFNFSDVYNNLILKFLDLKSN